MKVILKTGLQLISILLLVVGFKAHSQTVVKGVVRDGMSKQVLPMVSVVFQGSKGVATNEDGSYYIQSASNRHTTIIFSSSGYKTQKKTIEAGKEQVLNIELIPDPKALEKVVVKSNRKAKYSNKNNPAVELIRKVIDNKSKNRLHAYDFVQYEQYEKLDLALTNKPEKLMKSKLLKNYAFIMDNVDSTVLEGRSIIPIYLEERLAQKYFRKEPVENKTYLLGEKKVNFGEFFDSKGISAYLDKLYADIDIYSNNIAILATQFLSPIADAAPSFYRFYIRDTSVIDGVKVVQMYFTPRNINDLLFRGTLFITLDGNYAVQKINMTISKHANLNWTNELRINQDFEKGVDDRYHVSKSGMLAEFALTKKSAGSILGQRTVSYKNFIINTPAADSIYKGKDLVISGNHQYADSFWTSSRHVPLTVSEAKAYYNIDSLRNMKSYNKLMKVATLLFSGYWGLGGFDIGNTNTFYSFNDVEGFRARIGGRTTTNFSKKIYFEQYLAYGFKDEKFKGSVSGTFSLNNKSIYTYPLKYLRLTYQYDTKIPGRELQYASEDNFFLSFKRGSNKMYLYNRSIKGELVNEFGKNFTLTAGLKNLQQTPAGSIAFKKGQAGNETIVNHITTTELSAELRWAPNEKFYQGKNYRTPIITKYPIFRLRYIAGIKGLFKGEYSFQNINLNISKRMYMAQAGYTDIILDGGYVFGKVPFPLLTIHKANQTYAYQLSAYNLMNFMEFVSDKYAAVNLDMYLNGFILNRVPLLRKLKLREVASVKVLYGSLRDENNPEKNNDALNFPVNENGILTTYNLNNGPYIEASVGIANIFKLVRVDLVRRLSYLNHPQVSEWGIRSRIRFDF
ncbi:MAG TPA: DUF5686 family protein [Ferruginibacter sp.]|nr:DUF5686 family protein [Ferruginibacter sp.]